MAGWTVPPTDLILGDPDGAHIELLAADAKITLYNEFGTPIMVFDGTSTFFGETFSQINIRNKEGQDRLQLDQFQVALTGNTGADVRMVAGALPDQQPRVEFLTQPITDQIPHRGEIRAEHIDAPEYGGRLVIQSPTFNAHTAAVLTMESQQTSVADPLATLDANLLVNGGTILNAVEINGAATFAGGKLLVDSQSAACTAAYSPTTTTPTALTGTTITVTTSRPGATWEAEWTADVDLTTAGACTVVVQLDVDGTNQPAQALWNPANVAVGFRSTVGQGWGGTLAAAGSHTFVLEGSRATGAGVGRINAQHTTLRVRVYE